MFQPKTSRRNFMKCSATVAAGLSIGNIALAGDKHARARSLAQKGCTPEVRETLSGPWPTIATPFTRHGDIDFDALRKHIDFMIEVGKAKAIVLTWGNSLCSILTDAEIAQLAKVVARHVNKRAYVVATDDQWWTGKEVEFAKYCVDVDVDMLMVLPPDWARSTTTQTLVTHYSAVAEHIPVMLVTNYLAKRPAVGLDLIRRLCAEVPGVMALKDDVAGPWIRKVCLAANEHMALSAGGQKQNHMNMYPYGVGGYLSTFMMFNPKVAWRYWNAIEASNLDEARTVIRDYDMRLFDYILKSEGSFDAAIHGILELAGLTTRYRRAPYYSLTDAQMQDLSNFMNKNNLL